jgi:hypothetical protein
MRRDDSKVGRLARAGVQSVAVVAILAVAVGPLVAEVAVRIITGDTLGFNGADHTALLMTAIAVLAGVASRGDPTGDSSGGGGDSSPQGPPSQSP